MLDRWWETSRMEDPGDQCHDGLFHVDIRLGRAFEEGHVWMTGGVQWRKGGEVSDRGHMGLIFDHDWCPILLKVNQPVMGRFESERKKRAADKRFHWQ